MAYLSKFDPTFNDWRTSTNTMNTKHTPKPWNYAHGSTDLLTHDGDDVAYVDTAIPTRSKAEQRANARLIAAAPDLLEAAKAFIHAKAVCNTINAPMERDAIDLLLAAIAKATK